MLRYAQDAAGDTVVGLVHFVSEPHCAMNIKVVTFYSEGYPNDAGIPLRNHMLTMRAIAQDNGLAFTAYSPRRVRELGAPDLVREYPDETALPENHSLHKIGFSAWKPFIMIHALRELGRSDVLFYLDVNMSKYPSYRWRLENAIRIAQDVLSRVDLWVGRETNDPEIKASHHSNAHQISEIGGATAFAFEFPQLIVNNIVLRNTPAARRVLLEWLALCRVPRFILPPCAEDRPAGYRWFCPEQSVLNMLVARYIQEGKLPAFYPGVGYGRGAAHERFVPGLDHVQHLASDAAEPAVQVPLERQFQHEFAEAEAYLSAMHSARNESLPVCDGWSSVETSIQDWRAVDGASVRTLSCGSFVLRDGAGRDFFLVRTESDRFHEAEVELTVEAKPLPDANVGFHVQHWGGIDVCTFGTDGSVVLPGLALEATCEDIDCEFRSYRVRFFNLHHTLSFGTGNPGGYYLGQGREQYEIRAIRVRVRPLSQSMLD
jgi:hypothetical protein